MDLLFKILVITFIGSIPLFFFLPEVAEVTVLIAYISLILFGVLATDDRTPEEIETYRQRSLLAQFKAKDFKDFVLIKTESSSNCLYSMGYSNRVYSVVGHNYKSGEKFKKLFLKREDADQYFDKKETK